MPSIEANILIPETNVSTGWHHAITFTERLAARRSGHSTRAFNMEFAQEQMNAWRSQKPFTEDVHFERLLESRGVTEKEFFEVVGEPLEPGRYRSAPWVEALLGAFRSKSASPQAAPGSWFTPILSPLIDMAWSRLRKSILALASGGTVPFDPETVATLFVPNLIQVLHQMVDRTLVLELHVAKLMESLEGDTPEERFQSFVNRMCEHGPLLTLLEEYPVLARQLARAADQWVAVSLEFLERLTSDQDEIRARFAMDIDPGKLVNVDGGKGDTHRRGRSVLIAQFESGRKVVYKPRRMSLDRHFQELLDWVNHKLSAESNQPAFRKLDVLDRGEYGWVEFADGSECTGCEQIRRFYRRQGGYLALLYALAAAQELLHIWGEIV